MHPSLAVPEPAAPPAPAESATAESATAVAAQPSHGASVARRLGAGLLAAVVLGTVAGLLGGTFLRLLTLLTGDQVHFTLLGTVLVVVTFTVPMVPGALAAAWRLRWAGTVLLAGGAGFLLLESVVIVLQEDLAQVVERGAATVALALLLVVAMWALVVVEAIAVGRLSRAWGGRRIGTSS